MTRSSRLLVLAAASLAFAASARAGGNKSSLAGISIPRSIVAAPVQTGALPAALPFSALPAVPSAASVAAAKAERPDTISSLREHGAAAAKAAAQDDLGSATAGSETNFMRAAGLGGAISRGGSDAAPSPGTSRGGFNARLGAPGPKQSPRKSEAPRPAASQSGVGKWLVFGAGGVALVAALSPAALAWAIGLSVLGTGLVILTRHRNKALWGALLIAGLSTVWLVKETRQPQRPPEPTRSAAKKDSRPAVTRALPHAAPVKDQPKLEEQLPAEHDHEHAAAPESALGLVPFKDTLTGKWGFRKANGDVVPAIYDTITGFRDGVAQVSLVGPDGQLLHGLMDADGRLIASPQFAHIRPLRDGLWAVEKDGKWGFIGKDFGEGNYSVAPQFDKVGPLGDGNVPVGVIGQDGKMKYGFVDQSGRPINNESYDRVFPFQNERAAVQVGQKWGVIDQNGNTVVPPAYDRIDARASSQGTMTIGVRQQDGSYKYGQIDRYGNPLNQPQFDAVKGYSEDLAAAQLSGKWGYIDGTGRWVVQPQFARADSFSRGAAKVQDATGIYYVDPQGNRVPAPAPIQKK